MPSGSTPLSAQKTLGSFLLLRLKLFQQAFPYLVASETGSQMQPGKSQVRKSPATRPTTTCLASMLRRLSHHPLLSSGQKVSAPSPSGLNDSPVSRGRCADLGFQNMAGRWSGRGDLATWVAPSGFSEETQKVACVWAGGGAGRLRDAPPGFGFGEDLSEVPSAGFQEPLRAAGFGSAVRVSARHTAVQLPERQSGPSPSVSNPEANLRVIE